MRAEQIIMRLARLIMSGRLQKMARGETAAKPPGKGQLIRQATRLMRRSGKL